MEFRVWVTLVSSSAARLLAVGLIDRGYTVSPLNGAPGADQPVFLEGSLSTVVAVGLSHSKLLDYDEVEDDEDDDEDDDDGDPSDEEVEMAVLHHGNAMAMVVTKDVSEILTGLGASWHSIVVHERQGSCDWAKGQTHGAQPEPKPSRFESIG